jgi:hypothetical protein
MAELKLQVLRAGGAVEDLGTVAYWHQNPLKRLIWSIKSILRNAWRSL